MITVADQVRPWLIPRKTFAIRIQVHDGAHISRNGTGSTTSHPATRMRFRPETSARRPAK